MRLAPSQLLLTDQRGCKVLLKWSFQHDAIFYSAFGKSFTGQSEKWQWFVIRVGVS